MMEFCIEYYLVSRSLLSYLAIITSNNFDRKMIVKKHDYFDIKKHFPIIKMIGSYKKPFEILLVCRFPINQITGF
jgi:hypothetical protein